MKSEDAINRENLRTSYDRKAGDRDRLQIAPWKVEERQCIQRVLAPGGLFYMGVWGGWDFEGILADDSYRLQRFFSFCTDNTKNDPSRYSKPHGLVKDLICLSNDVVALPCTDQGLTNALDALAQILIALARFPGLAQ